MATVTIDPAPIARVLLHALSQKARTRRELVALVRSVGFDQHTARVRLGQVLSMLECVSFVRRRGALFVLSPSVKRLRGGKWRLE